MSLRSIMFPLAHRLLRWVTGRALPPLAFPVVRGPLRGARFVLGAASGEGGGASVYVNRVEPAKTQVLLSVLEPGQIVFDVGANIGYYTVLASRRVGRSGRVVACEPLVRNLSYLHRHVALNRADNVTVIPAACSGSSGLRRFVRGVDWAAGRISEDDGSDTDAHYAVTVTIDEIVRQTRFVPNVLKIDVEGAEEEVLNGASETLRSARPILLLGVHSPRLRAACTSMLASYGYPEPVVCDEVEGDTELLFRPADKPRVAVAGTGKR